MFDDIIKPKRKYDLSVIEKNIEYFIHNFLFEAMDSVTLEMIKNGVNSYLVAYGLQTSDVIYDFAQKTVIIMFDKERLVFPMEN